MAIFNHQIYSCGHDVTTALFTALHGGAFEAGVVPVLNVLTMSLLMTVVLEYSGSIIAPTIMHFLWNGTGALVLGGVSLAEDYPSIKTVTDFRGTGDYTNYAFTAEFSIKEGSDIVNSEELAENWYYGFIYVSFSVFLQSNEYKNRRNEGGKHHENSKPEINQRSGKRKQRGFWKTDHHASGIPIQTGVYVYEE